MTKRGQARGYDVAFYIPWIGPLLSGGADMPRGGAETQIYLLARGLAARGVRTCVISYATRGDLPESVDGVDVVVRPPPAFMSRPGAAGKVAEVATVWRTIARVRADVFVQRGTSVDAGLVALAAKAKRRRFVYSSVSTIDFDREALGKPRATALFRAGLRLADTIIVQTEEQVGLCHDRLGRESVLIKSIAERPRGTRTEGEALLWIGKYAAYKRPERFVELARAVPEARFWLVGVPSEKDSPEIEAEVEQLARETPNLDVVPPRPRDELMELVDRAVAIVSTSDFEGMPNTFLEGWARGVPSLAFGHDPDGVIASRGLGACAGGSPDQLAAHARELWATRTDQAALAARCREYVEREHAVEAVVDSWIDALGLAR